jgi:hypothetical protein
MAADAAMGRRLVSVTVPSMGDAKNANFASCDADGFFAPPSASSSRVRANPTRSIRSTKPVPTGPKGQKRPADVIGNAVRVMRSATGEEADDVIDDAQIAPAERDQVRRSKKIAELPVQCMA